MTLLQQKALFRARELCGQAEAMLYDHNLPKDHENKVSLPRLREHLDNATKTIAQAQNWISAIEEDSKP